MGERGSFATEPRSSTDASCGACSAAAAAPPADDIPVVGAEAGPVRVPSAPEAWGGARTGNEPTLSERVADYRLEAVLDPVKHTVEGKEQLTWRNRSARTVRSLYF